MKRIGTVFIVFISLMFGINRDANAQGINYKLTPTATVTSTPVPPLINPPSWHYSSPFKALSTTPEDTAIAYWDPDSTGNFNWYFLPSDITIDTGAAQIPTVFVFNRYAERFTLPATGNWATRYIDSVEILFSPVTVPTDGTDDSLILEIRAGETLFYPAGPQSDPTAWYDTLLGYNTIIPPLDSVIFDVGELTQDQIYDTIIPLRYKLPATYKFPGTTSAIKIPDFFVCLYTPDTDQTEAQFAIRGDSVTMPTPLDSLAVSDQDVYRGMWAVYDPTTYPYHESNYAGLTFNDMGTQTDYFYTNFIIIAYMSNQLTNAVDESGNPQFVLEPNYPNPVSTSTEIDYNLAVASPVTLTVYNELGEQVSSIVNELQGPGAHAATFNVGTLPSGLYYYKLQAGDFVDSKSMVVSK